MSWRVTDLPKDLLGLVLKGLYCRDLCRLATVDHHHRQTLQSHVECRLRTIPIHLTLADDSVFSGGRCHTSHHLIVIGHANPCECGSMRLQLCNRAVCRCRRGLLHDGHVHTDFLVACREQMRWLKVSLPELDGGDAAQVPVPVGILSREEAVAPKGLRLSMPTLMYLPNVRDAHGKCIMDHNQRIDVAIGNLDLPRKEIGKRSWACCGYCSFHSQGAWANWNQSCTVSGPVGTAGSTGPTRQDAAIQRGQVRQERKAQVAVNRRRTRSTASVMHHRQSRFLQQPRAGRSSHHRH